MEKKIWIFILVTSGVAGFATSLMEWSECSRFLGSNYITETPLGALFLLTHVSTVVLALAMLGNSSIGKIVYNSIAVLLILSFGTGLFEIFGNAIMCTVEIPSVISVCCCVFSMVAIVRSQKEG